jgi:hypothetical protein
MIGSNWGVPWWERASLERASFFKQLNACFYKWRREGKLKDDLNVGEHVAWLFGYKNVSNFYKNSSSHKPTIELMVGENGWIIYKMLLARRTYEENNSRRH